jgi:putative transposase
MGGRSSIVKNRRHTPERIIRRLREADRMLGEGTDLALVCKELEVSEATYHRWRARYGGMKADDAKRLKELERENATLKRMVADKELEVQALKEIAKGRMSLLCQWFVGVCGNRDVGVTIGRRA